MAGDRKSSGNHTDGHFTDSCICHFHAGAVHSGRFGRRPVKVEKDTRKDVVA